MSAYDVENRTYRFATVLATLASVFGAVNDEGVVAIKSRLKYYQKRGFAPPSHGIGREIEYTFYDIMDWAIALSLAKLGLPARFVIKNVGRGCYAERVEKHAKRGFCYLFYYPSLVMEQLPDDENPMTWNIIAREIDFEGFLQMIQNGRQEGKQTDFCIADAVYLLNTLRSELSKTL